MKIKRLDIAGFKSFPDKATLVFDQPIIGIVGPNGCGKSNIVDAIRWVIGEQSVKALRASTRSDVIFAGSESRPAMGMAEVTLTFDNSDKSAPAQYAEMTEIAVTRRLNRDGSSDYFINRVPCRLKDITDLLLGTGASSRAYSIIEQGRIGLIVSSKPEDRRLMIEEAAGITKYNARKREAERKMEHTRNNLMRVNDIVKELEKQLRSLSYQAKKAEKFKNHKARYKALDLQFASVHFHGYQEQLEEIKKKIKGLTEESEGLKAELNTKENEMEAKGLALAEMEETLSKWQESVSGLDQQIKLDERNIQVFTDDIERIKERGGEIETQRSELILALEAQRAKATELEEQRRLGLKARVDAENELKEAEAGFTKAAKEYAQLQEETDQLKQTVNETTQALDRATHKLETIAWRIGENRNRTEKNREERIEANRQYEALKAEKAEFVEALGGLRQMKLNLDNKHDDTADALQRAQTAFLNTEESLASKRNELTGIRSRLASLKELESSLEGFGEGVKQVLAEKKEESALIDALARLIEVDSIYEKAVAACLGEKLQWIVADGFDSVMDAIEALAASKAGRAGFMLLASKQQTEHVPPPDGLTSLAKFVREKNDRGDYIQRLLGNVFLAESQQEACALWERHEGRFAFVTKEGTFIDQTGGITGGGEAMAQTILKRGREIGELEKKSSGFQEEIAQLETRRMKEIETIREMEETIEKLRKEGHNHDIRISEREKDLHHIDVELAQLSSRIESADKEFTAFQQEMHELTQERTKHQQMEADNRQKRKEAEEELKELQEALGEYSEKREKAQTLLTEKRVKHVEAEEALKRLDSELLAARQRETDIAGQIERIRFEDKRGGERIEELERQIVQTKQKLEARINERENANDKYKDKRQTLLAEQEALRKMGDHLKQKRVELEEKREYISKVALEKNEIQMNIRHQRSRVYEKYGIELESEYKTHLPESELTEDEEQELETLGDQIERMQASGVNLAAIKEHDEVSERFEFLKTQEDDLKHSLEMLEDAIRKINRTTKKRLKETFEVINENFSKLFPQLFNGGEARLEFTDPSDLLNTGVEIIARPPGKSQSINSLMSGGEKALTAVSLIFAIFLYRPTPFCLLDEVDAPLDDMNISRFNSTLKRISKTSQFVVVTHNKKTMEISNTLYGVTMEEPGISKLVSVNLNT